MPCPPRSPAETPSPAPGSGSDSGFGSGSGFGSDDDRLHALAAGELGREEARALEHRISEDPARAARFRAIQAVEGALRSEAMLDPAPDLVARVIAGRPGRRPVLHVPRAAERIARFAAAVLLAFLAWMAATSAWPVAASAAPPPALTTSLRPALELLPADLDAGAFWTGAAAAAIDTPDDAGPTIAVVLGLVLLVGGLFVARRLLGRPDDGGARGQLPTSEGRR